MPYNFDSNGVIVPLYAHFSILPPNQSKTLQISFSDGHKNSPFHHRANGFLPDILLSYLSVSEYRLSVCVIRHFHKTSPSFPVGRKCANEHSETVNRHKPSDNQTSLVHLIVPYSIPYSDRVTPCAIGSIRLYGTVNELTKTELYACLS